ncbi:hypothetical protein K7432_009276 [Basidiobolus ranarum]|uniref:Cyclin N-terminal domain-containing protein n=1 Tax=Basidiobolus ranarum TaxID=34480 RepID=A0ABR2WQG8_9FUNG
MIHTYIRPFSSKFVSSFVVNLWYGTAHADSSMLEAFCDRVLSWCDNSPSNIYIALKYLQRLKQLCPHLSGSKGSEVRIFSIALLLASKYLEDRPFNNRTWSVITGLNSYETGVMEREFLACIHYQLHVCEEEFRNWKHFIDTQNQHYQLIMGQIGLHGYMSPARNFKVVPYIPLQQTAQYYPRVNLI